MKLEIALLVAAVSIQSVLSHKYKLSGDSLLVRGLFNSKLLTQCKPTAPPAAGRLLQDGSLEEFDNLTAMSDIYEDWEDQATAMRLPAGMWELMPEEPEDLVYETSAMRERKERGRDAFRTLKVMQLECAKDIRTVCNIGDKNVPTCAEKIYTACPECFKLGEKVQKECLCACEKKGTVNECFQARKDQSKRSDPAPVDISAYYEFPEEVVVTQAPEVVLTDAPTSKPSGLPSSSPTKRLLRSLEVEAASGRRRKDSMGGQPYTEKIPRKEVAGALRQIQTCFKQKFVQLSEQCKQALRKRKGDVGVKPTPKPTLAPVAGGGGATRAPSTAAPVAGGNNGITNPPTPTPTTAAPTTAAPNDGDKPVNPPADPPTVLDPIDDAADKFEEDDDMTLIILASAAGGTALFVLLTARRFIKNRKNQIGNGAVIPGDENKKSMRSMAEQDIVPAKSFNDEDPAQGGEEDDDASDPAASVRGSVAGSVRSGASKMAPGVLGAAALARQSGVSHGDLDCSVRGSVAASVRSGASGSVRSGGPGSFAASVRSGPAGSVAGSVRSGAAGSVAGSVRSGAAGSVAGSVRSGGAGSVAASFRSGASGSVVGSVHGSVHDEVDDIPDSASVAGSVASTASKKSILSKVSQALSRSGSSPRTSAASAIKDQLPMAWEKSSHVSAASKPISDDDL